MTKRTQGKPKDDAPAETSAAPPARVDKVSVGRIVHYIAPAVAAFVGQDDKALSCRPGIVVRVWDEASGNVNLQVFNDGANDRPYTAPESPLQSWRKSVAFDAAAAGNTWHWPTACPHHNKPAKEDGAPPA